MATAVVPETHPEAFQLEISNTEFKYGSTKTATQVKEMVIFQDGIQFVMDVCRRDYNSRKFWCLASVLLGLAGRTAMESCSLIRPVEVDIIQFYQMLPPVLHHLM